MIDEIARGGMGIVFLGEDTTLRNKVAIKIVKPESATATAVDRFVREARILASFTHPNIVPVHRAGTSDGIAWYVMSFIEGETLGQRLDRGALQPEDALRVADDLLSALEAVHAKGILHRDIKPANIFLVSGRAVLADFGIAKESSSETRVQTETGYALGTPAYMPPEHQVDAASELSDQCSAAMVIYECFTGRRWQFDSQTATADWRGVPPHVAAALKRALSWEPRERFANVTALRAALAGKPVVVAPARNRALFNAAVLAVVVSAILMLGWIISPTRAAGPMRVQLQTFTVEGAGPELGDSLTASLLASLRNAADIRFTTAPGLMGMRRPDLSIGGTVTPRGGRVSAALQVRHSDGEMAFDVRAEGPRESIVDSMAVHVLLGILSASPGAMPGDLPSAAMPHSAAGVTLFARAEAKYARADWAAADAGYRAALASDSTCLLCLQRLSLITRWQRLSVDPALTQRLSDNIDSFPPHYRLMISAGTAADRWTQLEALRTRARDVDLAQFVYADEVLHRGPLSGLQRADALSGFQRAVQLRPGFAPGWEHLAMAAIGVGDSALADSALARFEQTLYGSDLTSQALLAVNRTGFAWRFASPEYAAAVTNGLLAAMAAFPDLVHGARYLLAYDAPGSALHVGRRFEGWPGRPDLVVPGLSAQIAAHLALGQADSARAAMARLRGYSADAELTLGAAGYEAALILIDSLDARAALPDLLATLEPLTRQGAAEPAQRSRAAFFLALVAQRAGDPQAARWRSMVTNSPPLTFFLAADSAGSRLPRRALEISEPLLAFDSAGRGGDPFLRGLLHAMRAQWHADAGNTIQAVRSMRWHENFDFIGVPTSTAVQALEPDWAFGTIARWRRARLLDGRPDGQREACTAYADVQRLWSTADARYQARRDSAATRHRELGCAATR